MTESFIELNEDEFDERFPLVRNHINPTAGWAFDDEGGCLFETYGDEFAFVKRYDPSKIWTLVDGDDGDLYVISGLHYVNRVGYLLSRDPIPPNSTVQVHIPMDDHDGDQP